MKKQKHRKSRAQASAAIAETHVDHLPAKYGNGQADRPLVKYLEPSFTEALKNHMHQAKKKALASEE